MGLAIVDSDGPSASASTSDRGDVFERMTDSAREAITLAQDEARELRHNYIGTEHLLLGLLHVRDASGTEMVRMIGLDLETGRAQIRHTIGRGVAASSGHIPFTERAKRALGEAAREANRLRHRSLTPSHLLLGLLSDEDNLARRVLTESGIDPDDLRERVSGRSEPEDQSYVELVMRSLADAAEALRVLVERDHGAFIDELIVRFVIGQRLSAAGMYDADVSVDRREVVGDRVIHIDLTVGEPPYVGLVVNYPKDREVPVVTDELVRRAKDVTTLSYPVLLVLLLPDDVREQMQDDAGPDWPYEPGVTGTLSRDDGEKEIAMSCLAVHETDLAPMYVFGLAVD